MSCFWQGARWGGWRSRQVHFYRHSASSGGDVKDCPRHNILSRTTKCTLTFSQNLIKSNVILSYDHFEPRVFLCNSHANLAVRSLPIQ